MVESRRQRRARLWREGLARRFGGNKHKANPAVSYPDGSSERVSTPDPQQLYTQYLAGEPGFGTFEEYISTFYPNATYEFKAELADKIGDFFQYKRAIFEGSVPLDET